MQRHLKNLFMAAFVLTGLSGCLNESFNGTLNAGKSFYAYVNGQTISVPAGKYEATVTGQQFLFSKYISLSLPVRKQQQTINIQVPGDLEIPAKGGTVRIPAATAQQPFDLSATFDAAKVTEGPEKSGYQSCTYQTCASESCDENGNNCQPSDCTTWDGQEYVEYHMQETVQHVSSIITEPGKSAALATFKGTSDVTEEIDDSVGDCQ
jgi:hypothetical protein